MGEAWQTLLDHAGGQLNEGRVSFASTDKPACPDAFITIVPHLAVLQVSGTDAGSFLQSQLTCDIPGLPAHAATLTAWCNPKGRVITTLLIQPADEGFLLLVPAVLAATVLRRLGMYVLRSDVQLHAISEAMPILGAAGDTVQTHGNNSLALPGRRLLLVRADAVLDTWDRLRQSSPAADSGCWERLDIEAGIPWLDEQTSEQFLPQELNLDDTRALSFTKGCFPGQEVIARLRYRGRVKRRMYRLHTEPGDSVATGESLRDSHASTIGTILDKAPSPYGGETVLAVLAGESTSGGMTWRENGSMLHVDSEAIPATTENQ